MVITKEILTAMRNCRELTIIKRTNGVTYILCNKIEIPSLNTSVDKEYTIESRCNYPKMYENYYVSQQENIQTVLSFLKVNDNISVAVRDCEMDANLTLIEIHLLIVRNSKAQNEKYYDFLLSATTEKYL